MTFLLYNFPIELCVFYKSKLAQVVNAVSWMCIDLVVPIKMNIRKIKLVLDTGLDPADITKHFSLQNQRRE